MLLHNQMSHRQGSTLCHDLYFCLPPPLFQIVTFTNFLKTYRILLLYAKFGTLSEDKISVHMRPASSINNQNLHA
jgi:hypothetical protein